MEQIEVASGKFNMVTTEAEFTRLESELSCLPVRWSMRLQEKIRQVKAEICEDCKQIGHTRLESIVALRTHTASCRSSGEDIRSSAIEPWPS
jgi:hypothetical protein